MVEEDPKEEVAGPQQDLPNNILKGKRTKRQRPQSPLPFTITSQDSSSGGGGYVGNGDCIDNNNHNNNANANSSTSSAEQVPHEFATTEEDEYTARCLILLAQGRQDDVVIKEPSHKFDQDQDYGVPEKFISKRYIETPVSGNGKAGMYVYDCKTCGRTFPSFQALGGHRASHKKPKNMVAEEKKLFMDVSDEEKEIIFKNRHKINNNNKKNSSSLSLDFISNRGMSSNGDINLQKSASFPRIHECSHCGAEFASGQALGGHMRRHRGAPVIANTTLCLGQISPETTDQDCDHEPGAKRIRSGLTLDLNLPAPEDDHLNRESKFGLAPKQQQEERQRTHVLSSTTKLVDCHY